MDDFLRDIVDEGGEQDDDDSFNFPSFYTINPSSGAKPTRPYAASVASSRPRAGVRVPSSCSYNSRSGSGTLTGSSPDDRWPSRYGSQSRAAFSSGGGGAALRPTATAARPSLDECLSLSSRQTYRSIAVASQVATRAPMMCGRTQNSRSGLDWTASTVPLTELDKAYRAGSVYTAGKIQTSKASPRRRIRRTMHDNLKTEDEISGSEDIPASKLGATSVAGASKHGCSRKRPRSDVQVETLLEAAAMLCSSGRCALTEWHKSRHMISIIYFSVSEMTWMTGDLSTSFVLGNRNLVEICIEFTQGQVGLLSDVQRDLQESYTDVIVEDNVLRILCQSTDADTDEKENNNKSTDTNVLRDIEGPEEIPNVLHRHGNVAFVSTLCQYGKADNGVDTSSRALSVSSAGSAQDTTLHATNVGARALERTVVTLDVRSLLERVCQVNDSTQGTAELAGATETVVNALKSRVCLLAVLEMCGRRGIVVESVDRERMQISALAWIDQRPTNFLISAEALVNPKSTENIAKPRSTSSWVKVEFELLQGRQMEFNAFARESAVYLSHQLASDTLVEFAVSDGCCKTSEILAHNQQAQQSTRELYPGSYDVGAAEVAELVEMLSKFSQVEIQCEILCTLWGVLTTGHSPDREIDRGHLDYVLSQMTENTTGEVQRIALALQLQLRPTECFPEDTRELCGILRSSVTRRNTTKGEGEWRHCGDKKTGSFVVGLSPARDSAGGQRAPSSPVHAWGHRVSQCAVTDSRVYFLYEWLRRRPNGVATR